MKVKYNSKRGYAMGSNDLEEKNFTPISAKYDPTGPVEAEYGPMPGHVHWVKLQGSRPGVDTFRVDFVADRRCFPEGHTPPDENGVKWVKHGDTVTLEF